MYENYIIDGNAVYEIDETCLHSRGKNNQPEGRKSMENTEDNKIADMQILAEQESEKLTIL